MGAARVACDADEATTGAPDTGALTGAATGTLEARAEVTMSAAGPCSAGNGATVLEALFVTVHVT
jgi:hypothetical protein